MSDFNTLIAILKKPPKKRTHNDIDLIVSMLDSIKFFKDRNLSLKDLRYVSQGLTYDYVETDKDIIQYNTFGNSFYVILQGSVSVLIPFKVENEEGIIETIFKDVATLDSGKSFGELALINKTRRFSLNNVLEMLQLEQKNQHIWLAWNESVMKKH